MKKCNNCAHYEREAEYFHNEAKRYETLYRDVQKMIVNLILDSDQFESTIRSIVNGQITSSQ